MFWNEKLQIISFLCQSFVANKKIACWFQEWEPIKSFSCVPLEFLIYNFYEVNIFLCFTHVQEDYWHIIFHQNILIRIWFYRPSYEKTVENEGLPILDKYPLKGDLILRFDIVFPVYLTRASKDLIKSAFAVSQVGKDSHEAINKLVLADKILRVEREQQLPPI